MKTTLFYFSATGNSLNLARRLASEIGNCEIIAMAKAIRENKIEVKTEKAGFIFPVYAWGMPRIVTEFIDKIEIKKDCYLFSVATCVAIPGNTQKELKAALKKKGAVLSAGFTARAGRASLMKLNALDRIIMLLDNKRNKIKYYYDRISEIAEYVRNGSLISPETSSFGANIFGTILHELGIKSFAKKDGEFVIKNTCSSCGTCVKVCPRKNIVLTASGPEFNNNCELCHACIQWCPNFAIQHPDFDAEVKQYRNSGVTLIDMVLN